jgi:hypothetical protein
VLSPACRRVAHFDVAEGERDIEQSDREDDRPDDGSSGRAVDDLEKEYLIGGGRAGGIDAHDTDSDAEAGGTSKGGSCGRSCSCVGDDKAARVEGRNVVLGVTIVAMALAGLLLYSAITEFSTNTALIAAAAAARALLLACFSAPCLSHRNPLTILFCCYFFLPVPAEDARSESTRFLVIILALVLSGLVLLASITGLIGLCGFSSADKTAFKIGFWLHIVLGWAFAALTVVLLYMWDGNYASRTLKASALPSASSSTSSTSTTATATFLEVDTAIAASAAGLSGDVAAAALVEVDAAAAAAAPSDPSRATVAWNNLLHSHLWFMVLTVALFMLNVRPLHRPCSLLTAL